MNVETRENNKALLIGTIIYGIGNIGTKFLSFLIVPLYTYFIQPGDLGDYDLLMTTVSLLSPLLTMKISEKNGLLSNIKAVNGTEDLLVVTNQGIVIRTSLEQVKKAGRNTLGVRIIKLNEGQEVSSIAIAAKEEIIETEDEQEKCST